MATSNLKNLYQSQYDDGEWSGPGWYQWLLKWVTTREQVAAEFIPPATHKLLDLGCGEGILLGLALSKINTGTGVDLLPHRLKIARQRFATEIKAGKLSFTEHDLDKPLPFKSSEFDVITLISVVEYVLDPQTLLKEIHRVLRPGGILIIEVPNLAYILERWRLLRGELVGVAHAPGWQGGRLHHFTFSSLEGLLTETGFNVEQRSASGFLAQIRSMFPSLLSADIVIVARKK